MTIENSRVGLACIYRISPDDPMLIERMLNKHGARWTWYAHRDSPNEAKRILSVLMPDSQLVLLEVQA